MEQRWWRRGDGTIWMITDADQIQRVLSDGWQEVASPTGDTLPAATTDSEDVSATASSEDLAAVDTAMRADFGLEPNPRVTAAKPIKKVQKPGEKGGE